MTNGDGPVSYWGQHQSRHWQGEVCERFHCHKLDEWSGDQPHGWNGTIFRRYPEYFGRDRPAHHRLDRRRHRRRFNDETLSRDSCRHDRGSRGRQRLFAASRHEAQSEQCYRRDHQVGGSANLHRGCCRAARYAAGLVDHQPDPWVHSEHHRRYSDLGRRSVFWANCSGASSVACQAKLELATRICFQG